MLDSFAAGYDTVQIPRMVLTIIAIVVIMIFVWSIYAFLRAILLFIFSHGDTAKIKKARDAIRYMIIWLILSIVFLFIFPIIFQKAHVRWYEYYSAKNIFLRAGELVREIANAPTLIKDGYGPANSSIFDTTDRGDGMTQINGEL